MKITEIPVTSVSVGPICMSFEFELVCRFVDSSSKITIVSVGLIIVK